jgi:hypothetical protein
MVMAPVVKTLDMELPLILPKNPLAIMDIFAGPPLNPPKREEAKSRKNFAPPLD